jgi:RTX calcium-binding nonapeptide repeat (4 copies)
MLMLVVLSVTMPLFVSVLATDSNSIGDITNDFASNLNDRINELVSNALNDTGSILNSTNAMVSNASNLTSSQIVVSNNNVSSFVSNSNSSAGADSIIKNQISTVNGVCTANAVGGAGNDTLASGGVCNDQLTGGPGADKFICGEGSDTVRDFSAEEGDIIVDPQNCEKTI